MASVLGRCFFQLLGQKRRRQTMAWLCLLAVSPAEMMGGSQLGLKLQDPLLVLPLVVLL